MVQGVKLLDTTNEPIHPCKPTKRNVTAAIMVSLDWLFRNLQDTTSTAKIRNPMSTPVSRLMYSIHVFVGLKSFSCRTVGSFKILSPVSFKPKVLRYLANRTFFFCRYAA